MFDLHAAIRSCKVLFSISNAFINLGSSQLSSFSAFTAKKNASEMLIKNVITHPYAVCMLNDNFGFSFREPSSSYNKLRSRETFNHSRIPGLMFARTSQSITKTTWISIVTSSQEMSNQSSPHISCKDSCEHSVLHQGNNYPQLIIFVILTTCLLDKVTILY